MEAGGDVSLRKISIMKMAFLILLRLKREFKKKKVINSNIHNN